MEKTVFVNNDMVQKQLQAADQLRADRQQGLGQQGVVPQQVAGLSELERLYLQLGKAYYQGGFEDPIPELLPMFDKITRLRKKLAQQAKANPPAAGGSISGSSQPKGGKSMGGGSASGDSQPAVNPWKFCGACGKKLSRDAKYCGGCGATQP